MQEEFTEGTELCARLVLYPMRCCGSVPIRDSDPKNLDPQYPALIMVAKETEIFFRWNYQTWKYKFSIEPVQN
jgi:hypothetical protein